MICYMFKIFEAKSEWRWTQQSPKGIAPEDVKKIKEIYDENVLITANIFYLQVKWGFTKIYRVPWMWIL